jgi:hypothetical protein
VALPQEVLSELAYKNYRSVRASALFFIILGIIFFIAGIKIIANPDKRPDVDPMLKHPVFGVVCLLEHFQFHCFA